MIMECSFCYLCFDKDWKFGVCSKLMLFYPPFNQLMAELFSVEVTLSLWIPKHTIFPLQVGFEASNLTQVPLQPTCAHS